MINQLKLQNVSNPIAEQNGVYLFFVRCGGGQILRRDPPTLFQASIATSYHPGPQSSPTFKVSWDQAAQGRQGGSHEIVLLSSIVGTITRR